MNRQNSKTCLVILSGDETRSWHSPLSRELRSWRRQQILAESERAAREGGYEAYVLYDAFETLLAAGAVTPAA